jgi:hypothetical protein
MGDEVRRADRRPGRVARAQLSQTASQKEWSNAKFGNN